MFHQTDAGPSTVGYHDSGPSDGTAVILLRGFGPTRFLRRETPRSGQQAALAGYDWGGRAACIVAAL